MYFSDIEKVEKQNLNIFLLLEILRLQLLRLLQLPWKDSLSMTFLGKDFKQNENTSLLLETWKKNSSLGKFRKIMEKQFFPWSTFARFGKILRQGAPHLELAPPPPRAFLGAFEATVLLAPPSPFVRTIFRLLLVFSEKHQYCHFLVCLHHLPSFSITIQHYFSTACLRTIFESLIFC